MTAVRSWARRTRSAISASWSDSDPLVFKLAFRKRCETFDCDSADEPDDEDSDPDIDDTPYKLAYMAPFQES